MLLVARKGSVLENAASSPRTLSGHKHTRKFKMNKLKWWFRIVGVFYLLLAVMNLWGVFNPQAFSGMIVFPFPTSAGVVQAFLDAWAAFAFEMLGIGTFLLWASRNPLKHLSTVWFVVWLEFTHGVLDDLYLIVRGYDAVGYTVFIVIHLIIIVTGVMFAREVSANMPQSSAQPAAPVKA